MKVKSIFLNNYWINKKIKLKLHTIYFKTVKIKGHFAQKTMGYS